MVTIPSDRSSDPESMEPILSRGHDRRWYNRPEGKRISKFCYNDYNLTPSSAARPLSCWHLYNALFHSARGCLMPKSSLQKELTDHNCESDKDRYNLPEACEDSLQPAE